MLIIVTKMKSTIHSFLLEPTDSTDVQYSPEPTLSLTATLTQYIVKIAFLISVFTD